MKNYLRLIMFVFLFISCNSKSTKKINSKQINEETWTVSNTKIKERFFPTEKGIVKFDTILSNKNIQISIIKSDLDSYVIQESFDIDNKKYVDKYRDAEINLIIKQNSKKILDTIFRKNHFSNFINEDFSKIAIFHNYWFEKIQDDKLEFLGIINKPETDYSFAFNHYFNLKSKKFEVVEKLEEFD